MMAMLSLSNCTRGGTERLTAVYVTKISECPTLALDLRRQPDEGLAKIS